MANKLDRLKQDLVEVDGAIEEVELYLTTGGLEEEYKDLKDKYDLLKEHLKDHIETMENYMSDIN